MQKKLWLSNILTNGYFTLIKLDKTPKILNDAFSTKQYIAEAQPLNVVRNRTYTWDKVFKNGPSKICGRQPLKTLK